MKKVLFAEVNYKLIKRGYKSNLSIINNNIDKDYEITNRNISNFLQSFYLKLSYDELLALKQADQYQSDKSKLRCFTPPTKADLVNRSHTNIWTFAPVQYYEGKHPCEKPSLLLEHILLTSTKENDVVLDVFAGSCSTAKACLKLNRRFIGCDLDDRYFIK